MEIITKDDVKNVELVAVEFNIKTCSFRAFFSYGNSTTPVFAIKISYYQSTTGTWNSFADIQEPGDYMVTADLYEELRAELQEVSNDFMKQYKKGAEINEKVNHIISNYRGFVMPG